MKRTYQPSVVRRKRTHGFLVRCAPRAAVQFSPLAAPRAASVWLFKPESGEVNQCFARRYRLTKTDEFSSVFGFRRAIRGKLLMLHYQPRPEGIPNQGWAWSSARSCSSVRSTATGSSASCASSSGCGGPVCRV
jgi:hypothetical protein